MRGTTLAGQSTSHIIFTMITITINHHHLHHRPANIEQASVVLHVLKGDDHGLDDDDDGFQRSIQSF